MKFRIAFISLLIISLTQNLSSDDQPYSARSEKISGHKIPDRIKKIESELFSLDTEIEKLHKLISQYQKALSYVKNEFSELSCAMYYLCNHAKYGINLSYDVSSVLSMISLKNAITFLSSEQNDLLKEIQTLEHSKRVISDTYQKLKHQIEILQKEYETNTLKEKTDELSRRKHELICDKIKSIDELIHELEAEEYVGFLKAPMAKLKQNRVLNFSNPCFGEKKSKGNRVQFITKPAAKVFAPESGIVLFFGSIEDDQILILQHDQKHKIILYGIANSFVKVGSYVHRNQIIGEMYDSTQNKIALEVQLLLNGTEANTIHFFKN